MPKIMMKRQQLDDEEKVQLNLLIRINCVMKSINTNIDIMQ